MRRQRGKKGAHIDESWLLPYADLLTLLVALFIVLFAMSDISSQKYEELAGVFRSEFSGGGSGILENQEEPIETPVDSGELQEDDGVNEDEEDVGQGPTEGDEELDRLEHLQESIQGYIKENDLDEQFHTDLTEEGLLITIVNDVFFESGSASVSEAGEGVARDVSNLLYTDPPYEIVVSGHADDVPIGSAIYDSNWELSVFRALNFMNLVLENDKLDPTLFSAKGFGEYKPIVPNTSEENRAKNRRVEVLILPNFDISLEP